MTASEANRKRVLALLAIERQQMYEQPKVGEKKRPAEQRGKPINAMNLTRPIHGQVDGK